VAEWNGWPAGYHPHGTLPMIRTMLRLRPSRVDPSPGRCLGNPRPAPHFTHHLADVLVASVNTLVSRAEATRCRCGQGCEPVPNLAV
jgi:hypothetical protein